jgi:hypothetical protein
MSIIVDIQVKKEASFTNTTTPLARSTLTWSGDQGKVPTAGSSPSSKRTFSFKQTLVTVVVNEPNVLSTGETPCLWIF